jgi:cyanophycin synthetase
MIPFDEVQKEVFDNKPIFKKIIETHGDETLFTYWQNNFKKPNSDFADRQQELVTVVANITRERLGESASHKVAEYLTKDSFVSTADHHQFLCHPFFSNEILMQSLINKNMGLNTVVVFGCAGISMDNSSFPRGIFYHDESGSEVRLPFISLADRHTPAYSLQAYSKKDFGNVNSKAILNEVYFSEKALAREKYREQATIANFHAWKKIQGQEKTSLIYIDQESIAIQLLINQILTKENIITTILTTKTGLDAFEKHFPNIIGSFFTTADRGSFLFWAVVDGKREQLIRNGQTLQNKSGTFVLELTTESITREIQNETIFPTMALTLSILSFYYGLTLGGGFSQVNYLSEMKYAYLKVAKDLQYKDEITKVEATETNHFSGEFILATIGRGRAHATLLDLILYSEHKTIAKIEKLATSMTLKQAVSYMMPEYYKIITGVHADTKLPYDLPHAMIDYKTKQKKKCLHCGNSQTNHTFEWLSQTVSILRSRFDRMIIKSFIGRGATWLAERIELPMFKFFRLIRMATFVTGDDIKPITERSLLIVNEAKRRGIALSQVVMLGRPTEYFFGTYGGRNLCFDSIPRPKHMETDSIFWLDDKLTLKKKLQNNNIPVPKGGSFSHWNDMVKAFETMQKPVIVKPRLGSRGRHTTTHIYTLNELKRAVDIAKQLCRYVIMEEHLEGSVYRATMIGGVFKGLLRGDPPRITGDGEQTIAELIAEKNKNSPDQVKAVAVTEKHLEFLARTGYTLNTVLPTGKTIDLTEKIGLAYGGYTAEMSPITHPKLIATLERAAKVVADPIIGFDVISTDVTADPDTTRWGIIEANSLPFINLHYEPLEGPSIDIAPYIWDLWK